MEFYDIGKYKIKLNGGFWDRNRKYTMMGIIVFDDNDHELEKKHFYIDGDISDILENMTEEEISWIYENPANTIIKVLHNGKIKIENKESLDSMINFRNMTNCDKQRIENSIWILLQYKDEIAEILADNECDYYDFINTLQDIKEAMEK